MTFLPMKKRGKKGLEVGHSYPGLVSIEIKLPQKLIAKWDCG